MISELININEIDNSFINKDYLENEFNNNPYAKVLLLKEDNKVIGYIYYSDIYERVEINQFEIDKNYRNKGNGNLLLQAMINKVHKDITLEVREDNTYAIKVYEKNGFIKTATRKGYYNGVDGILMERKDSSK
ncbi:MAG: GNAT family N-acetyltransferase [Bacilli bacterium]|nr:GNAT family N-acetyltransferase [Bacilli bacterium]